MRRMAAMLAVGSVLAVALVRFTAHAEQPYRRYATAADAVAAGERARGWLPAWMPAAATDVHLQGDLDTNEWWIRARLPAAAADSLRERLVPVDAGSVRVRRPLRSAGWWIRGRMEGRRASGEGRGLRVFRGTGAAVPASTSMAFDDAAGVVYAWSGGTGAD